jgi:transposase
MKLSELLLIIQDEKKSEDYLRSVGILKTFSNCPRCNGTSLGMIRGDRWKCYKCKTEWTRRKDSILSLVRIKYSEFLLCLKFFELELTNQVCCAELGLNYKTIELVYRYFRVTFTEDQGTNSVSPSEEMKGDDIIIYVNFINNKVELSKDKSILGPNVFIKIKRSRIPNSAAAYTLKFKKNFPVKKRNKVLSEFDRFWRFAKERLLRYRGVREMYFYQFLKEIEFRYNNNSKDLFQELGNKIAQKRWVVR